MDGRSEGKRKVVRKLGMGNGGKRKGGKEGRRKGGKEGRRKGGEEGGKQ